MFECVLPDPAELRRLDDAALATAIAESTRITAAAEARTSAGIAELVRRRVVDEHPDWACDDWDACAAEVSCVLTVSSGRASGLMGDAIALRDKLPAVGALHLAGELSAYAAGIICNRTALVTDPVALAAVDADIAAAASRFGPLSKYKLEKAVDAIVERRDPKAVRRARTSMRGRDFSIGDPSDDSGTTSVWGRLSTPDAALLHQAIGSLIHSVCDDDPRTLAQRRADAVGALAARATRLPCRCGSPDCPAGSGDDEVAARFVIHVLTDPSALGAQPDDAMHGDRSDGPDEDGPSDGPDGGGPDPDDLPPCPEPPGPPPAESSPPDPVRPAAALIAELPRGGVLPAASVADLIARGATVRSLTAADAVANGYRLPASHDRFVRARDITCRFPGCDRPAVGADIDHIIPWPAGPTHPSNNSCKCRKHHLLKTFWPGWTERQEPDGTLTVTTPAGVSYTTKPLAPLLFPRFNPTTAPLPPITCEPPSPARGLKMPRRKRTRAKARAARIRAERALNEALVAERNVAPPF